MGGITSFLWRCPQRPHSIRSFRNHEKSPSLANLCARTQTSLNFFAKVPVPFFQPKKTHEIWFAYGDFLSRFRHEPLTRKLPTNSGINALLSKVTQRVKIRMPFVFAHSPPPPRQTGDRSAGMGGDEGPPNEDRTEGRLLPRRTRTPLLTPQGCVGGGGGEYAARKISHNMAWHYLICVKISSDAHAPHCVAPPRGCGKGIGSSVDGVGILFFLPPTKSEIRGKGGCRVWRLPNFTPANFI